MTAIASQYPIGTRVQLNHADLEVTVIGHNGRRLLCKASPESEAFEVDANVVVWLPTPNEIAAAAAKIRAGWSLPDFDRRRVGPPEAIAWTVPESRPDGDHFERRRSLKVCA